LGSDPDRNNREMTTIKTPTQKNHLRLFQESRNLFGQSGFAVVLWWMVTALVSRLRASPRAFTLIVTALNLDNF
jgi:hypothetical protein